jgi:hypothetical protein
MARLTLNDGRRNEVGSSLRRRVQPVEGLLYRLESSGNGGSPQVHVVRVLQNGWHEAKLINV